MKRYNPYKYIEREEVEEAVKYDYVIRDGKKVKKPHSTNDKKKIVYDDGKAKEVRKTSSEVRKRSIASKKGAKKAKVHKGAADRKRKKSMAKHTWEQYELDYDARFKEGIFSLNPKKFTRMLMDMSKHYDQYYKMLKVVDHNNNGIIEIRILHWNNHVGTIKLEVNEDGCRVIENHNNGNYITFDRGDEVDFSEVLRDLKTTCEFSWRKTFNSSTNDVRYRDYDMIHVF